MIARVGGDEFAVLLTGSTSADDAGERFRRELALYNRGPSDFALEANIGTAVFDPSGDETLHDLVARADAAMYLEKRLSVQRRGSPRPTPTE